MKPMMSGKHVARESDKKYCFSSCSLKEGGKWIACDALECEVEWYHCECVDIDPENLPDGEWMCPPCIVAVKGARPKAPFSQFPMDKGVETRPRGFDNFGEPSLEDINQRKRELEMDIAREEMRGLEIKLEETKRRSESGGGYSGVSARDFEEILGKLSLEERGMEGKARRSGLFEVARHQISYIDRSGHIRTWT